MKKYLKHIDNTISIFLMTSVLFTLISQLPIIVELDITQWFSIPIWILFGIYLLISKQIGFYRFELIIVINFLFFSSLLIIFSIITNINYFLESELFYNITLSLYIFFIGLFIPNPNDKIFKQINFTYILGSVILVFNIYFKFFQDGFLFDFNGFIYASKNSISSILVTSIVFLYFYKSGPFMSVIKYFFMFFVLVLVLALKSRANIFGVVVITFIPFFYPKYDYKRIPPLIIGLLIVLLMYISDGSFNQIINNVLFLGRTDLDSISSGRLDMIFIDFPNFIRGHEIFGNPLKYVEIFILNSLLKYGLLLGLMPILLAYFPIYFSILKTPFTRDHYAKVFFSIVLFYSINSLFEAITPFGPGAKNFILWLYLGLIVKKYKKIKNVKLIV